MQGGPQALVARARDYFGVETDWERVPDDPARARRSDALLALAFCRRRVPRRRAAAQHRRTGQRAGLVVLAARRRRRRHGAARVAPPLAPARRRPALSPPLRVRPDDACGRGVAPPPGGLLRGTLHRRRLGPRPPRHARRGGRGAPAHVRLADVAVRRRQRHRAGAVVGRTTSGATGPLLAHGRLRHLHVAHQRRLLRRSRHRWTDRVALCLPTGSARRPGPHDRRAGHHPAAPGRRRGAAADRPRAARRRGPPRVGHRHPGGSRTARAAPRPGGRRAGACARSRRPPARR